MANLRDEETKLFSRELFDEELERLSKKRNFNIGLIVINFGNVIAAKEIAKILTSSVRTYDTVARLSESEFGIILEDVEEEALLSIVERIKDKLNKKFKDLKESTAFSIVWNLSKASLETLRKHIRN